MLNAVIDYLPSPLDVKPIVGHRAENPEEVIAKPDDSAEFAALAFKVMTDPYVGKLTFFRVYSGTLTSGSYIKNSTKDKRERVVVYYKCTLTHVKKSTLFTQAISLLQLVLKIQVLATHYVVKRMTLS